MAKNQMIGIALMVLGVLLLYFGLQSSQSLADQVSEAFTGRFTDNTLLFIIGGAVSLAAGAYAMFGRR